MRPCCPHVLRWPPNTWPGDDAYKQVHDALLEFTGEPSEVALRRISDGLGLNSDEIIAAMDSDQRHG